MYHAQFQIYSFEEDIPVGVYRGLFLRFVNLRFGRSCQNLQYQGYINMVSLNRKKENHLT